MPILSNTFSPVIIQVGRTSDDLKGLTTQITDLGSIDGVVGGGLGDDLGGRRRVGIDVALVVDATDSMQFVIDSVRERLSNMIDSLQTMVDTTRVGIVAYRDRGEDYVTRWVDFSFNKTHKLNQFLATLEAGGGGNWPEAVYDGVDVAMHDLSWRTKSRRIVVVVSGSSPHPESVSNILNLAQSFRSGGGYVSVMDLAAKMHEDFERALWKQTAHLTKDAFSPSPLPGFYQEFRYTMASIATAGGGEFIPLTDEKKMMRQIVEIAFGLRWKEELKRYLRDLT